MATYCDDECKMTGGCCDFCRHYVDDYEDMEGRFAGEGLCVVKNERVDASGGCEDDFYCCLADEREV